jgi:hypothetical protein
VAWLVDSCRPVAATSRGFLGKKPCAGGVLYLIATGKRASMSPQAASNGYEHSPGGYSYCRSRPMTMMFLLIILGANDKRAPQAIANGLERP